MDLKATIASGYRNRLILIAIGTLLYAAWCFYDATIGYPEKQEQYEAYQQVKDQYPERWDEVWAGMIQENGWDAQPDKVDAWNIRTQWIQFAIVFPIGAYCLFSLALWSRRYIGADESTLYASGGVEVPFDKITSIDASRWDSKGIARVYYDNGGGQQDILLDDWKFERTPTDEIYDRILANVDEQIIEGGTAHAVPEEAEPDPVTEPQVDPAKEKQEI